MKLRKDSPLERAAMRLAKFARMMFDYACDNGGHDGNPPSWDKNCARCGWIREQRQALERYERQIAKHAKRRAK